MSPCCPTPSLSDTFPPTPWPREIQDYFWGPPRRGARLCCHEAEADSYGASSMASCARRFLASSAFAACARGDARRPSAPPTSQPAAGVARHPRPAPCNAPPRRTREGNANVGEREQARLSINTTGVFPSDGSTVPARVIALHPGGQHKWWRARLSEAVSKHHWRDVGKGLGVNRVSSLGRPHEVDRGPPASGSKYGARVARKSAPNWRSEFGLGQLCFPHNGDRATWHAPRSTQAARKLLAGPGRSQKKSCCKRVRRTRTPSCALAGI